MTHLAISPDEVLETPPAVGSDRATRLGHSREGRELLGYRFGVGPLRVSLIAGCHADEPVGPALLRRLVAHLAGLADDHQLLREVSWFIVPHANPDGAERNSGWSEKEKEGSDFLLEAYLSSVVREPPGDDMEFGFPRDKHDREARPENLAVAAFLRPGAPFALHGSLHGMAFAPGPWFLIEEGWIERTFALRENLRRRVARMGYALFDVDRKGEKGFWRIDAGFTTRPDSRAMRKHFELLDDPGTAALFRLSSMEFVRSLGGDPFTLVSEMPLFLVPSGMELKDFRQRLSEWMAEDGAEAAAAFAREAGVRPMPVADQMQLQLAFLNEGLAAVG